MSYLGKEVRLRRLFNPSSGKILVIALDHAIAHGVLEGIEKIQQAIDRIVGSRPDAITLQKGIVQRCMLNHAGRIPFILKCTSFSPYYPAYDAFTGDVEEAVRLGAEAIAVGATVGGKDQAKLLSQLARVTKEAEQYGMPVVTHIYPKGELIDKNSRFSAENVAYAARAAAELGVDIIKTYYTGDPESFRKVIQSCPAKVVVSGGPKLESLEEVLRMTYDAMAVGAAGVTYGRNIWQRKDMVQAISMLKGIVHEGLEVREVLKRKPLEVETL